MRIKDIAGQIRKANEITIIVGAGASLSAGIPSAKELVEIANRDFAPALGKLTKNERKDYGIVMRTLSPTRRKELIQPLLDNSKINWGHIALACLIRECNFSRILTFNFDLVLERTASLLGMHLPVYDFGVSPTDQISELASPAIFHLHGQSYGLRLMNSVEETNVHSEELRPILADSLQKHLTIVTGYSGVADGALRVIEEEFNSKSDLIWLGYSEAPPDHLRRLLSKDFAEYVGGNDFDRTMIALAHELGCFPPKVIENPPSHVLGELADVVDYPIAAEAGLDILTDVRQRLASEARKWNEGTTGTGATQRAVLSGEAWKAPDDLSDLSDEEREMRSWTLVNLGAQLRREAKASSGEEQRQKFAEAYSSYSDAIRLKPEMPAAYNNWGNTLTDEAKVRSLGDRAKLFEEAGEKYKQALSIKPNMLEALENWTIALLDESDSLSGNERVKKIAEAEAKARAFKSISKKADYNLASVFVLQGEVGAALDELEACHIDGELPDRSHIESDPDLDPIRDQPRFHALLDKL